MPPRRIRLLPHRNEIYGWRIVQPAIKHIFGKCLSRLGTRDCKSLLCNIGCGFQAFLRTEHDGKPVLFEPCEETAGASTGSAEVAISTPSFNDFQTKLAEAYERISSQDAQLFQCNMIFDRLAQVLEDYHKFNQIYSV